MTNRRVSSELKAKLEQILKAPKADEGICSQVGVALQREFNDAIVDWPKFTGDVEFPIPHPTETPKSAFIATRDLWAGEYGNNRREAIAWLLEVVVETKPEPAQPQSPKRFSIPKL